MSIKTIALVLLVLVLCAVSLGCTKDSGPEQLMRTQSQLPVVYHDLDSALGAGKPVVVYFNEAWCSGCKDQRPIIQEISLAAGDKAVVVVLDRSANENVAERYGIDIAPNMVILDTSGEVVKTGYTGGDELKVLIDGL
ncbi:MAG: thioredoxin family protein [ANME-2 cluster archaeon]|nr:thioredoxin family protein [ANME-2 cluster archaeon]